MHEFIPEKINERLGKEAVEASAAKEEQKEQTTESSQSTQALTSNAMFEGKLAFIIAVLLYLVNDSDWGTHKPPLLSLPNIGDDLLICIDTIQPYTSSYFSQEKIILH